MSHFQDLPEMPFGRLCLWRHAKAKRGDFADFERPLTKRGRKDAEQLALWMVREAVQPATVLCSPARRTRETWEILRRHLAIEPDTRLLKSLYNASASTLLARIRAVPATAGSVLVVGHNPGLEQLAIDLAGTESDREKLAELQAKFPTAALAVLEAGVSSWGALDKASARLTKFVRPRDFR